MRKVVKEFIERAKDIELHSIEADFERIMEIYEATGRDKNMLVATAHNDIWDLLVDYMRVYRAEKPHGKNDTAENLQLKQARVNIEYMLACMVQALANLGIKLTGAFLQRCGEVPFFGGTFASYVESTYKVMAVNGTFPEDAPQGTPEPQRGTGGQQQANEPTGAPKAKYKALKSDIEKELPMLYGSDTEVFVFNNAIKANYMVLDDKTGKYIWSKSKELLAYMCGRLYCGDRVTDDNVLVKGAAQRFPATEIRKLFEGKSVANNRNNMKKPPKGYIVIDKFFKIPTQRETKFKQ